MQHAWGIKCRFGIVTVRLAEIETLNGSEILLDLRMSFTIVPIQNQFHTECEQNACNDATSLDMQMPVCDDESHHTITRSVLQFCFDEFLLFSVDKFLDRRELMDLPGNRRHRECKLRHVFLCDRWASLLVFQ